MEATPRPWKPGFIADSHFDRDKDGKQIRHHHIVWQAIESADGKQVATTGIYVQRHGRPAIRISNGEFEANLRLIVDAVNNYDHFRRIEKLAGELADKLESLDVVPLACDYRKCTSIAFREWYALRSLARALKTELEGKS